jgi:hypothetical protein
MSAFQIATAFAVLDMLFLMIPGSVTLANGPDTDNSCFWKRYRRLLRLRLEVILAHAAFFFHVCPESGCTETDAGVDGGADGGK